MKTSYDPERDPTRTTATRSDRLAYALGFLMGLCGLAMLIHHTDGWTGFSVFTLLWGSRICDAVYNKAEERRRAGIAELKRRARAMGIPVDEEDA